MMSGFSYSACPVDENGHRWAMRGSERVRLLCDDAPGDWPIIALDDNGATWRYGLDGRRVFFKRLKVPSKAFWINLYPSGAAALHMSVEAADVQAGSDRLGSARRVEVTL